MIGLPSRTETLTERLKTGFAGGPCGRHETEASIPWASTLAGETIIGSGHAPIGNGECIEYGEFASIRMVGRLAAREDGMTDRDLTSCRRRGSGGPRARRSPSRGTATKPRSSAASIPAATVARSRCSTVRCAFSKLSGSGPTSCPARRRSKRCGSSTIRAACSAPRRRRFAPAEIGLDAFGWNIENADLVERLAEAAKAQERA